MILSKYEYKDRPPIITIPKCGTRFVRNSDWINLSEIDIHPDSPQPPIDITQDTIITYRNPHEHIISAIQTDYVWGNITGKVLTEDNRIHGWNFDTIIQNMIDDKSEHWSPNLYKNLYRIWNIFGFEMIHLSKLSELFNYKIEYKPEFYDSHLMEHFKSKDEILSMISKVKLDELYSLCDKDKLWLNRILNNERGIVIYEDMQKVNDKVDGLVLQLEESNQINKELKEYIDWLNEEKKELLQSNKISEELIIRLKKDNSKKNFI
jgi:hypothetical protein